MIPGIPGPAPDDSATMGMGMTSRGGGGGIDRGESTELPCACGGRRRRSLSAKHLCSLPLIAPTPSMIEVHRVISDLDRRIHSLTSQ